MEFELVTTRGGDKGESSLYNGERRRKDDAIFEALGDLDELNSFLGPIRIVLEERLHSGIQDPFILTDYLRDVQKIIMNISSMIATPVKDELYKTIKVVTEEDINTLEEFEQDIMQYSYINEVFVFPGDDSMLSAQIDICRAICRRCERRVVKLIRDNNMTHLIDGQKFINRLSDFLFVMARYYTQ